MLRLGALGVGVANWKLLQPIPAVGDLPSNRALASIWAVWNVNPPAAAIAAIEPVQPQLVCLPPLNADSAPIRDEVPQEPATPTSPAAPMLPSETSALAARVGELSGERRCEDLTKSPIPMHPGQLGQP